MAGLSTSDFLKGPGAPPTGGNFGSGGGGSTGGRGGSRRASMIGLAVLMVATAMVFVAFTGAFVVRRDLANDWISIPLPHILWLNTGVLLASSLTLEWARRSLKTGARGSFNRRWTAGTSLGIVFLIGQAFAWLQLQDAGIYLATNPSVSFFYVLSAAHALHLIGGLGVLLYIDYQALTLKLGPGKRTAVDVSALFWHFLAILWVYLMMLFFFWE